MCYVYVSYIQITISENVEKWLASLVESTHETIGSLMHDVVLECGALSVDDCASKVHVVDNNKIQNSIYLCDVCKV